MIYELRTYTLHPGALPEYLRVQQEIGRRVRGDDYGKFEGGWTTEFGILNRYVHLWSYSDPNERSRLRGELYKNPGWVNEYLPAIRPLVHAQENKILQLLDGTSFNPPQGGKHLYELRTYRTHFQQAPNWLGHFRDILPARTEYSNLVGIWSADVGQLNEAVHLWSYVDLNQRADVRARVLKDPRWQAYLGKSLPLLQEQQAIVLVPTPTSPMQ